MADNTAYQDLLKDTSESKEDGNYFLITITDLNPNTSYPLQFRWMYKDKRINDNWSAVKLLTTPGESEPNTPSFTNSNVDVSEPEKIIITWDGSSDDVGNPEITNYDRIDVYIDGLPFDGTKAAYSFKTKGTAIIPAPAGTYQIVLYAVSKTGKLSPVSSAVTKTVTAAGVPIQTPTLPSGLSVATAPFAVTVNWNGSYSSSTFTGFKSIDIYAVGSDLGSSVTSGITSTNLVGSLTVNDTTNRINIGLDNLRQALGLSTNSDVYNATIFYYYNAVNTLGAKYGSPTYTRINSSSVIPTKANFVDLASGVISIENLVAGNGSFSSWLRTGSSGGARIELSGVSDFTNGGYTVQKGLVAYSSGNTELFNLDLDNGSLTINGSGTFTGDLSAGSGSSKFGSDTNGIWLGSANYSDSNVPFRVSRNGVLKAISGTIGGWTLGTTYLQGTNLKLDTTGIVVGSTSSSYLDISPSAITHRNSDGTASGKFTLTLGASPQLTISGTMTIDASSTIDGTSASTVKSGAASGSTALQPSGTLTGAVSGTATINGVAASTVTSGASKGATALQESASVIANASKQITSINTSGVTVYSGSSGTGARVIMNSSGIAGYNGSNQPTFSVSSSDGSAIFKGDITGASGTFGGVTIDSNGLSATQFSINSSGSATFSGTLNATSGYFGSSLYGWQFDSNGYLYAPGGGSYLYPTTNPGGNSNTYVLISDRGISASSGVFTGTGSALQVTGGNLEVVGTGTFTGKIYANNGITVGSNKTIAMGTGGITTAGTIATTGELQGWTLQVTGNGSTSGTGTILANYLGSTSSNGQGAVYQDSSGYLRVRTGTGSSRKIKDNIEPFTDILDYSQIINSMELVTFNYKPEIVIDPEIKQLGMIVEDLVQHVDNEFLIEYKNGNPVGIYYEKIPLFLVKAFQEMTQKINSLQERLDALEA